MTVYKIAELAKTSKSTVSRVLNGSENVSPDVRKRVLQVIKEHHFQPNRTAQNLSTGKTGMAMVISPGLGEGYFLKVLQGINQELTRKGIHMLTSFAKDTEDYVGLWEKFSSGYISDGLILLTPPREVLESVEIQNPFPSVICSGIPLQKGDYWEGCSSICFNNAQGITDLLNYLYKRGSRSIFYAAGREGLYDSDQRLQAFLSWSRTKRDISINYFRLNTEEMTDPGPPAVDYIKKRNLQPDTILGFNDFTTSAISRELDQRSASIPKLAGFDGEPISDLFGFTTIQVPSRQLGQEAARELKAQIDQSQSVRARQIQLPLTMKYHKIKN